MVKSSELIWERVHNFGSHTHIIKNKKTICGRDVSMYNTEVHKFPTKKCKRCLELARVERLPEMIIVSPEYVK